MPGAASVMRRASASASRRIRTIPMARHKGRTPRRHWMLLPSKNLLWSESGGSNRRRRFAPQQIFRRSEEHTSELQSHLNLVCRLLLEKKKTKESQDTFTAYGDLDNEFVT